MKKLVFALLVSTFLVPTIQAQCGAIETIEICDMTTVDGDSNGSPDGIINLYDRYNAATGASITPADGMWFDPNFTFALDEMTGDLYLWDLSNSSEAIDDYQFEFIDTSSGCPDDVAFALNVVLGPYSGEAFPGSGPDDVNFEVCDVGQDPCGSMATVNLFNLLQSNPTAHLNGVWEYDGASPNFISITPEGVFMADVPYQAGPPLVDDEVFELTYRVPGIAPCASLAETTVKVAVIRQVSAGSANSLTYCETDLIDGTLGVIDLRDDDYLVNEDIEGIWLASDDMTGEISGPGDSEVDFGNIYANLLATNPRFGTVTYDFTYFVENRSPICSDSESTVSFTIAEYIRPFSQVTPTTDFCAEDETVTTVNLYDYIDFTTEGSVLYDYPNDSCTNWEFISGPSDLGLVSNTGSLCSVLEDPTYTSQGTIDLTGVTNAEAGTYVFQFTVLPEYNGTVPGEVIFDLPDGCTSTSTTGHPCVGQSTMVTIVINPINYAGEPTANLEFCESDVPQPLDLVTLLESDPAEGPIYAGPMASWTDLDTGDPVTNPFTLPVIADQEVFNFEYTTVTPEGCEDTATLTFTVYEQYDAGEDGDVGVCPEGGIVDLFALLGGDPNDNGTWTGPNGYVSTTNEALFDPSADIEGPYTYTVPDNVLCAGDTATIQVSLFPINYAGEDTGDVELCAAALGGSVDLITLLDTNGTDTVYSGPEGTWTDTANGDPIANPFTIPTIVGSESFEFTYTTTTIDGCNAAATLAFTVFEQFEAGIDGILEICEDATIVDLFDSLGGTPGTNGTWTGPNGYSVSTANAPFDPATNSEGVYSYTVPANGACEPQSATVTVSFYDFNYAGEDTPDAELCEADTNGTIDLTTLLNTNGTDTVYNGPEGTWTDASTGDPISNPFTLPAVMGSQTFDFIYNTTTVNGCQDQATLSFTLYEQFNPGSGTTFPICPDGSAIDLFTLLTEDPDTNGTWTGPNGYSTADNAAPYDPTINEEGAYIYTVPANGSCEAVSATITIAFYPINYAGEDTSDVSVCYGDTDGTVNLASLLETNGTDTVYTGPDGIWTDIDTGDLIPNIYALPIIDGSQTFNFRYNTTTVNGCMDVATLTFTAFEQGNPGTSSNLELCEDDTTVNLFDSLGVTADTDGTWTGPDGYSAMGTNAPLDPATATSGAYSYTVPANGACDQQTAIVDVIIYELSNAGSDQELILCSGDYDFDLNDVLEETVTPGGTFTDLLTGDPIAGGVVNIGTLPQGETGFVYMVTNGVCAEDTAFITLDIIVVQPPSVAIETYCITEGITINDITVANAVNFTWYADATTSSSLDGTTVLVNGEDYYVAALDDNGCESERTLYTASILPLSDARCESGISDGVSDNDDGLNDTFDVGTLATAFPNFELTIFNRYGSIVYKGNGNSQAFNGTANQGASIGKKVPTGVYFYIFNPNDGVTAPFDGNFYLSR